MLRKYNDDVIDGDAGLVMLRKYNDDVIDPSKS